MNSTKNKHICRPQNLSSTFYYYYHFIIKYYLFIIFFFLSSHSSTHIFFFLPSPYTTLPTNQTYLTPSLSLLFGDPTEPLYPFFSYLLLLLSSSSSLLLFSPFFLDSQKNQFSLHFLPNSSKSKANFNKKNVHFPFLSIFFPFYFFFLPFSPPPLIGIEELLDGHCRQPSHDGDHPFPSSIFFSFIFPLIFSSPKHHFLSFL